MRLNSPVIITTLLLVLSFVAVSSALPNYEYNTKNSLTTSWPGPATFIAEVKSSQSLLQLVQRLFNDYFIGILNSQAEKNSKGSLKKTDSSLNVKNSSILGGPVLSNLFILWLCCMVIGLLLGTVVALIYNNLQKSPSLKAEEIPEESKETVYNLIKAIESDITNKNFSISHAAKKLSLTAKEINLLTKRVFKRPFNKYLLALRIEIVKERLRSSNASEIFITKSCGFASVAEMEKKFQSLVGATPHKYREKNIFI